MLAGPAKLYLLVLPNTKISMVQRELIFSASAVFLKGKSFQTALRKPQKSQAVLDITKNIFASRNDLAFLFHFSLF
jgi:hypothetical protein